MRIKRQLTREEILEQEFSFFGLQAFWGVTKHFGGLKATRELIELCHLDKDKYILDVGCGVGATDCYIAKRYGSRVVGIDKFERMIDWSYERAKRKVIEDRVKFTVADVQDLPFEDEPFDSVIGESVTAFAKDKKRAIREYIRVTKPGGYIGLNESTWIKIPPPKELVEYLSRSTGAEILTSDGWRELLEGAGLREIEVRNYKYNVLRELSHIRRYGLKDYSRAWYRFLSLYIRRRSAFKKYAKEIWPLPKNFLQYVGYGIYVGRK